MHVGDKKRPPLSLREGWIGDGRHAPHFQPLRYDRRSQALEVTLGELTREQVIKLCAEKRKAGWQVCLPQWTPPQEIKPPARRPAASMGPTGTPPCF
jgi:hypothetical protein